MNILKRKVFALLLITTMVVSQVLSLEILQAQTSNEIEVVLKEQDAYAKKLEVTTSIQGVTRFTLLQQEVAIESKDATSTTFFDVYRNGTYTVQANNEKGEVVEETNYEVNHFKDVEINDLHDRQLQLISRHTNTAYFLVNNEHKVVAQEKHNGVFEANYSYDKNGVYQVRVFDQENNELGFQFITITSLLDLNDKQERIIKNEDDLAQVKADLSGNYVLENDITLTSNVLNDVTFQGHLNGNGYTIENVQDTLFQNLENAVIENVIIKGKLAKSSRGTTIQNSGFYVEEEDANKDVALLLKSEATTFNNTFVLMNVEAKNVAGFVLEGTGNITNSYVSGYLKAENIYGFAKDMDIENSYISASLVGEKRILFSQKEVINCFYDYSINTIVDEKATAFSNEQIINELDLDGFVKKENYYPQLKCILEMKEKAQQLSLLSCVRVNTNSNLSALVENASINNQEETIKWDSEQASISNNTISLNEGNGEVRASNEAGDLNRFSLRSVESIEKATVGESTTATSTQITYPTRAGRYYKIQPSGGEEPLVPTTHQEALVGGWKIVYWDGSNVANDLKWNSTYIIYESDLNSLDEVAELTTKLGKNGGRLELSGNYAIGNVMTATITNPNTFDGTIYFESCDILSGTWTVLSNTKLNSTTTSATYTVTNNETSKYLRARFVCDTATGYEGTLMQATSNVVLLETPNVKIENKTRNDELYYIDDNLVASIESPEKVNEVIYQWFHVGSEEVIATGRNYTIKGSDIGKTLYVKVTPKTDSIFHGEKKSVNIEKILAIQSTTPVAKDNLKVVAKDDITVTLSMENSEGLYRYGYRKNGATSENIIPHMVSARNNSKIVITGLAANTKYDFYVQRVGENGYTDSDFSTDFISETTDKPHVSGDVVLSGKTVFEEELKVELKPEGSGQTGQFVWYRLDENGVRETPALATNVNSYKLQQDDINKKIEVVYEGTGNYTGEVTMISDTIMKKEYNAPAEKIIVNGKTDTTINVTLPTNTNGDKYIIGLSSTKEGIPIEYTKEGVVNSYSSAEQVQLEGLERDCDYFIFTRYAANETHQKSDWVSAELASSAKTEKKAFNGVIIFEYETTDLMGGQVLKASISTEDSTFNYKGTWEWTRIATDNARTPINNFTLTNDKRGTSYVVPTKEEVGVKYEVKFTANVGFEGSKTAQSNAVIETVNQQYATPSPDAIYMEAIDDSSFKVKMTEGEGSYRFAYKKADVTMLDSFGGFLTEVFTGDDNYTVIEKNVYSNTEVIIDGLDRNTKYIIKVQRVKDDKGEASDFAYSSQATSAEKQSVITKKTAIAGNVTLEGEMRFNEKIVATYNQAQYASKGSGDDLGGNWQWYRDTEKIANANSNEYTIVAEDIGKGLRVVYSMNSDDDFEGSVDSSTPSISKAISSSHIVTNLDSSFNTTTKLLEVKIESEAEANGQKVYYRIQLEGETAPNYPDEEALENWKEYKTVITISQDSAGREFEPNGNYVVYLLKTSTATHEGSSIFSKNFTIGKKAQLGKINLTGEIHVGKEAIATLSDANNDKGEWHWYYSATDYNTATPDTWVELKDGFSPTQDSTISTLVVPDEAKGRFLRAEFISSNNDIEGSVESGSSKKTVTKTYAERLKVTGKGYIGEPLTVTLENSDRDFKQMNLNDSYDTLINLYNSAGGKESTSYYLKNVKILTKNSFEVAVRDTMSLEVDESYMAISIALPDSKIYTNPDGTELALDSNDGYVNFDSQNKLRLLSAKSNKERIQFHYGTPISSAAEMTNFIAGLDKYNNRKGNYVITNNINMKNEVNKGVTTTNFSGTLNGDYHTISNVKTNIFTTFDGGTVKNLIFASGNLDINAREVGLLASDSTVDFTISRVYMANFSIAGDFNTAMFVGKPGGGYVVKESGSAGGSISTRNSFGNAIGNATVSGLLGWGSSKTGNGQKASVSDVSTINTTLNDLSKKWVSGCGAVYGGATDAKISAVGFNRIYSASPVDLPNNKGYVDNNNIGPLLGNLKGGVGGTTTIENAYYDGSLISANTMFSNTAGTMMTTKQMVGNGLSSGLGNQAWVYKEGFYPRLKWVVNEASVNSPNATDIVNLYAASRGAFISIDDKTTPEEIFNGEIKGSISIPEEFKNDNYTISATNGITVKNGILIPTGAIGTKVKVTVTYSDADGTATNTYDFTVKEKLAMIPTINMKGTTKFGETLSIDTGSVKGESFSWYRRKSGETTRTLIPGANASTYKLTSADIGCEIMAEVGAPGYATMGTSYVGLVTSVTPAVGPKEVNVTDNSISVKIDGVSGMIYELAYNDKGADNKTIVEETFQTGESLTIDKLSRNTTYEWYMRVAGGSGYEASAWSPVTEITTGKTEITGEITMGTNVNNGTNIDLSVPKTNGQIGTWKLERISENNDVEVINNSFSDLNNCSYKLQAADVGKKIKVTFTGSGSYQGSISKTSKVILKSNAQAPNAPNFVSATESTLKVNMNTVGRFDIGYSDNATGIIHVVEYEQNGMSDVEIPNLSRNKMYYVYARYSSDDANESSPWSAANFMQTSRTNVIGEISISGVFQTDKEILFQAPSTNGQTGTWKLERVIDNSSTTISHLNYQVDDMNRTLRYLLTDKDAKAQITATYSGNGDFQDSINKTSEKIANAKLSSTEDMPSLVEFESIKDYSIGVKVKDGKQVYQFGYALQGKTEITAFDATANAGTIITINGLARNTKYDLYVRKAEKTGYDASDWEKISEFTTDKSSLSGTIEYGIDAEGGTEETPKFGVASINKTYKAKYIPGVYDQAGDDSNVGTWQWYADDKAIVGATEESYKIQAMKGSPEISVRYIAKEESSFKGERSTNIGTLTKPAYKVPTTLPTVTANPEDGNNGSSLSIASTEIDDVFYYVQKANDETVPKVVLSSDAENNLEEEGKWFKAKSNNTVVVAPNTEYVVYISRLESNDFQTCGVISTRAVKTVKEQLNELTGVNIEEVNLGEDWKVLQDKEVKISIEGKPLDGVWQYYVSNNPNNEASWQNITAEIKNNVSEGKNETYAYTKAIFPLKYANGYYVRIVFSGRNDYEGSITYTSKAALLGTQIKGHAEVVSGNEIIVLKPINVQYVYGKNQDGTDIVDEESGKWTWYRETSIASGVFEEIEGKGVIGLQASYIPTGNDSGKKIYAVYTASRESIYSGSSSTQVLGTTLKADQNTPIDLSVRQVNGTHVQFNLPRNYKTDGKTIPEPQLEYKEKAVNVSDWSVNDAGESWIKNLKANTEYEVRAKFVGTSEYKPSGYSSSVDVTTKEQSFEENQLEMKTDVDNLTVGTRITATFSGKGFENGYFRVLRSNGTVVQDNIVGSKDDTKVTMEYECTNQDIGYNIIIHFQAAKSKSEYGGYVEKISEVVKKPTTKDVPSQPKLETIRLKETELKVEVDPHCEYVLSEFANPFNPLSNKWEKLKPDEVGGLIQDAKYHTFTGITPKKAYYLHARYAENASYNYGGSIVSSATTAWEKGNYSIEYVLNGGENNTNNKNAYNELDGEIIIYPPTKEGYNFVGWTSDTQTTPSEKVVIASGSEGNQKFTANWTPIKYSITYINNDGEFENENPIEYTIETESFTLTNPTKKGYTFVGWSKNGNDEKQVEVIIPKNSIGDLKFEAHFELKQYLISFDANEGKYVEGFTKEYNTKIGELPDTTREGHTFKGWFSEKTGGTKVTSDTLVPLDGATYYAQWQINQYDVVFDANGGTGVNKFTRDYDTELGTLPTTSKKGYDFVGWFTDANGGSQISETTKVKANLTTYFAHWKISEYTIGYDLTESSAVNDSRNPISYTFEKGYRLYEPTCPNKVFTGWTWRGLSTPNKQVVVDEGNFDDIMYIANWENPDYNVQFVTNGGSAVNTIGVKANEMIQEPAKPTKVGHTFDNWYEDEKCEKVWDFTKPINNNLTLYAKWTPLSYLVTFVTNSPTVITPQTVNYGEKVQAVASPQKEGYQFAGWYKEEQLLNVWDMQNDVVNAATSLYAKYLPILANVTSDTASDSTVNKMTKVSLHATNNATIYYTLDGSTPTNKSLVYRDPIVIEKNTTIKAFSAKADFVASEVVSFHYYVKGDITIEEDKNEIIKVQNPSNELIAAVISKEEYAQYLLGTNVNIRIVCNVVQQVVSDAIKTALKDSTIGGFYDISIYKEVGTQKEQVVSMLNKPIRLVIDVPTALYPKNDITRVFNVLRVHNGQVSVLNDLDLNPKTVTFESDSFSTYILCYKDSTQAKPEKPVEPNVPVTPSEPQVPPTPQTPSEPNEPSTPPKTPSEPNEPNTPPKTPSDDNKPVQNPDGSVDKGDISVKPNPDGKKPVINENGTISVPKDSEVSVGGNDVTLKDGGTVNKDGTISITKKGSIVSDGKTITFDKGARISSDGKIIVPKGSRVIIDGKEVYFEEGGEISFDGTYTMDEKVKKEEEKGKEKENNIPYLPIIALLVVGAAMYFIIMKRRKSE